MPARISGISSALYVTGFGLQTAQGTAATASATTTQWPKWLDGLDINPTIDMAKIMEGDGSQQVGLAFRRKQYWEWHLPFYPRAAEAGGMLFPLFGAGSDGATLLTASQVTHGGALKTAPAFLTLFGQLGASGGSNKQVTLADAVVNTVKISCKAGEPLKFEASGFALPTSAVATAALTPSYDTLVQPSLLTNQLFTVDGYTANTAAQAVAVADYTITITRNISPDDLFTQGLGPEGWLLPQFMVDFEYTSVWQDFSQFSAVYAGTSSVGASFDPALVGGLYQTISNGKFQVVATFPSAANSYALTLGVQNAQYTEAKLLPKTDGKAQRVKLAGFGMRNTAGGTDSANLSLNVWDVTATRYHQLYS